jgi:hypothetical protein
MSERLIRQSCHDAAALGILCQAENISAYCSHVAIVPTVVDNRIYCEAPAASGRAAPAASFT